MNTSVFEWQQACYSITSRLPGVVYRCGLDRSRSIEFVAGNYQSLTGYKKLEKMARIIHPSHIDRVLSEIKERLEPGIFCSIEYPICTAQGNEKWVLDQVTGVFDSITHKLLATEGMLMDITQRKQREGRLQIYSFLIDQTNDPIFVIDPKTAAVLATNTRACNSLGYTEEELLKLHAYDIDVKIQDEITWGEHVRSVREKQFIMQEGYYRCQDGTILPMEVNVKYVEDSGEAYMIAIARDVSERLEVQRILKKSDERFNLLSKASQDVIYDWDLKDNSIWWSDSFEKVMGTGLDREKFSFTHWCDHLHPDDRQRVLDSLNQTFFNRETNWTCEYRFRDSEGNYRYIFDRGYMIYHDSVLYRMVGAMQDITERKRHEGKLNERIVYEHLVNGLCFDFINCQADEVDDLINDSLCAVGEFIGSSRSYIFLISEEQGTLSNTHEWSRLEPQKEKWQKIPIEALEWWIKAFEKFKAINMRVADLPPEATFFKKMVQQQVESFVLMPMYSRGKLKGVLGFDSATERTWDENDIAMLNIIATVFTNAIIKRTNERELMDNERYLSQLIESSPVAIFVKDIEGRYIVSNKVFAGFFNKTPEELVGRKDTDLGLDPAVIDGIRSKDLMVIKDNKPLPPYEVEVNNPETGESHILEVIKVPVRRGRTPQVLGIGMDITARKQAEEKLQKEKNFSENLINTANVMIVGLDLKGRVLIFNKEAEKITGYTAGEIMGKPFFETIVPSVKFRHVWESFERFMDTGNIRTNDENPIITKLGEERFISWRNMPLKDGDKVIGSISFGIDVTEKRVAEQKFKEQYIELEKINKELDKFVYSASHDLKAPLSSILGLVNVARMEQLSEAHAQYFNMIEKNISKLNGFILDIINYSRNARTELVKQRVDLEELIRNAIEDVQFMNGFNKIKVHCEVKAPAPFYSDERRLKVIMNNLLSNAISYHLLNRPEPYIQIKMTVNKKQLVLQVIDNGQGIRKEYLSRIFDMFYRASDNSKGSGLGLYIVKEIVARMGGMISVESQEMHGAAFTVTLPNGKSC